MEKTMKKKKLVKNATKPTRPKFPEYLAASPAEWRGKKRTEWREVMSALERYSFGSAYTPDGNGLYRLQQLAQAITVQIETEDWVCW